MTKFKVEIIPPPLNDCDTWQFRWAELAWYKAPIFSANDGEYLRGKRSLGWWDLVRLLQRHQPSNGASRDTQPTLPDESSTLLIPFITNVPKHVIMNYDELLSCMSLQDEVVQSLRSSVIERIMTGVIVSSDVHVKEISQTLNPEIEDFIRRHLKYCTKITSTYQLESKPQFLMDANRDGLGFTPALEVQCNHVELWSRKFLETVG